MLSTRAKCLIGLATLAIGISSAVQASDLSVASDNPQQSFLDRAVDAAATDYFHNRCHVGLSIAAVTSEGRFFYNYGATKPHGHTLPTYSSVYEIASVTKTFTGALAAQAVEDGKMQADTDFRPYLPGSYANLAWQDRPITLATLITHRAGMPRDIPNSDAIFAKKDFNTLPYELNALQKGLNRDTLLSALHDISLSSEPGSKEAYSNAGYLVIGLGLEKVYRQPFETLMRERLLKPLGMDSTGFVVEGAERARLLTGYNREGRPMPYHLRNAGAAWGLYSTTEDMAKYMRWQLDGKYPVIQRIREPLVGTPQHGQAMPWHLAYDHGQPMLAHGGGSGGMSSQVVLFPAQDEGFTLLANDTCEGTESALKAFAMEVHAAPDGGRARP